MSGPVAVLEDASVHEARLSRAVALKAQVDEYNSKIAVQEALYTQYVDKLRALGFTPETVGQALADLDRELERLGSELDAKLDSLEEAMK